MNIPDFKAVFEFTPDLYLILSPDLRIVAVNDAYAKTTMTKREEIVERNLFDVFPDNPDDLKADGVSNLRRSLLRVIENKAPDAMPLQKYDIRIAGTEDFEERYWSPLNTPVLDEKKNIIYIIHRVEDVTETVRAKKRDVEQSEIMHELEITQKRYMKQLQESEEKFQKAFHLNLAGICITHLPDTAYVDVNSAFAKITGYSKEELIGHTSLELGLIPVAGHRGKVQQLLLAQGFAKDVEITIRNKSGKLFEVLTSAYTIVLGGEKHGIHVIYDITERKKAEEELIYLNKELEAFTYSVSHDLRAPLRAINGFAQMLEEDYHETFNEDCKRKLGVIRENAIKMGMLIDDMLTLSRLGRKHIQKSAIEMKGLMESALNEINKTVKHKTLIKIGELKPAFGDYSLLFQVVINLLANAIKYSSKVEAPLIEITSEEKNGETIYSIKDNGIGFDMRYCDKLFKVFQRLHSAEEFEGTGVGLAIVHRIITNHNGKVWAGSEVDKGATFYFSLPKQ